MSLAAFLASILLSLTTKVAHWVTFLKATFINKLIYQAAQSPSEWLKNTISLAEKHPEQLAKHLLKTFAFYTQSSQAVLFQFENEQGYILKECFNMSFPHKTLAVDKGSFTQHLQMLKGPIALKTLAPELPAALADFAAGWLLVPLFLGQQLYAFVLLADPTQSLKKDMAVHEAFTLFGQQSALLLKHVGQMQSLTIARQFENFNRLSAFMLHDLKNVFAQLQLIQINKQKHQHNPSFVESVYRSIDDIAGKIHYLLSQGKAQKNAPHMESINVAHALEKVIQLTSHQQPIPQLDWQVASKEIIIGGDPNSFVNVLSHLVENAQQATPLDGKVILSVKLENDSLLISIHDTGCGMDPEFVHVNLYRPFVSTKGKEGMGIGVYEAREYAHAVGGKLMIESLKGNGSTFQLQFPLAPKFLHPVAALP